MRERERGAQGGRKKNDVEGGSSRELERVGETKREGGIMIVSLSRSDGQGRRGVTQDGSK